MGKGILAVKIENTCPGASVSKEQLPKTTKKDAKNHGIGLKSIQKTVNKYNGSIEIKQEKQSFILFLYLPMEI